MTRSGQSAKPLPALTPTLTLTLTLALALALALTLTQVGRLWRLLTSRSGQVDPNEPHAAVHHAGGRQAMP